MENTIAKPQELTKANFDKVTEKGVSLVDFWAPWCSPCRLLTPIIDELAVDFNGKVNICKVNTDEEQELVVKFGLRSVPTIYIIKDGEVVDTILGAQSKEDLTKTINKYLVS